MKAAENSPSLSSFSQLFKNMGYKLEEHEKDGGGKGSRGFVVVLVRVVGVSLAMVEVMVLMIGVCL